MGYCLIFTLYGMILMILLLISVSIKKIKSSVKTTLYILVICASIGLAFLETLSVFVLIYDSSLFKLFTLVWNFRNVALFTYLYFFILYYIELIKPNKYEKFKDYFFKNKAVIISFIILVLFSIFYVIKIVPNNFQDGVMIFFGGKSTTTLLLIGALTSTGIIGVTFKFRHTRKNLFQCIVLVVVMLALIFPFQIKFKTITLIPFALMFILYVFYYNIENPDIVLLEEVKKLKDDIDKSNSTKSDFLFNLSYDLIDPIITIVSLSESLNNIQVLNNEEVVDDVKSIKLAGSALLDSIDNILDMSNDLSDSSMKEYSLYELLLRMKSLSEGRIGSKNIKFELDIDNNLNSKYVGDINKIQKVLINVLGNAIKFTEVGKVRLVVSSSGSDEENILHFKVSDTGCGIKDESKSFVFSDDNENSGVGLAYCRQLLTQMGGSIRFESSFGSGTTFYIDLPQRAVGNRLISEDIVVDENVDVSSIDYSKFKVLLVDDDNLDIKVTKRILEKYKVQFDVCTSTLKFLEMIKSGYVCDLVFLDHKMPELDGVQTIQALRKLEDYKLPIMISLTANVSESARDYYKSVGFDEYIAKPIEISELDRIINRFLK